MLVIDRNHLQALVCKDSHMQFVWPAVAMKKQQALRCAWNSTPFCTQFVFFWQGAVFFK